jgi:UDP-N-acetylmuramoylalanine--D-glutamate ligase
VICGDIEQAVRAAFADAQAQPMAAELNGGEAIVLLSPACASFDQFADFEARGEAFRQSVTDLARRPAKGALG